ncbi:MAG: glycosyltransferase [Candidatus Heimdallarchaeaceae archaeon]
MHIALFTDSYPPDVITGVAMIAQWQARALAKKGHKVCVITIGKKDCEYIDEFGVKVISFKSWLIKPAAPLRFKYSLKYRYLVKKLKEFSTDIVHAHSQFRTAYMGYRISKELSVPFIITFHTYFNTFIHYAFTQGFDRGFLKLISNNLVLREGFLQIVNFGTKGIYQLYKLASNVIVPIDEVKDFLVKNKIIQDDHIVVVKHFIPDEIVASFSLKNKLPIKDNNLIKFLTETKKKIILHCGRLSKEKRVDVLIKSFAKIKHSNTILVITSDGPEADKLKQLAMDLGVADRVYFTGFVSDEILNILYDKANIFVSPAIFDTFNLATAHALYINKPVVISALNPQRLFVTEESNGSVIPVSTKEIEMYSIAIDKWLSKKDIDIDNRTYRKQFSEDNGIASLEKVYLNVIRGYKSNQSATTDFFTILRRFFQKLFYLTITSMMYLSLLIGNQLKKDYITTASRK